jgi:SAM-dependent methyltransferase
VEARDRKGQSPEGWVAYALRGTDGPVAEIRPSTHRRPGLVDLRYGRRPGELIVSAHGHSSQLPLRTNGVAAVAATMCMPSIPVLDDLFAELRRVLRPAGTLAALVPSRSIRSLTELRIWRPLRRTLAGHPGFRNESACDLLHWLLVAADFAVMVDQRRTFWLPVPDGESAVHVIDGLVESGIWPPDVEPERLGQARQALARFAAPGRALPIPLRLLVARR